MNVRRLAPNDTNLAAVVEQLNSADWDDFEHPFSEQTLFDFLKDEHNYYFIVEINGRVAGAAHAYLMQHPAGQKYLYIDEVDTAKPFRRQGVATALMRELIKLAKETGADEAWLGADEGNDAAYALYRSLQPSTEEPGVIFTYKVK